MKSISRTRKRPSLVQAVPLGELAPDKMIGGTSGRLTVLHRAKNRGRKVYWVCLCECGNLYEAEGYALRKRVTTHCGCDSSIRSKSATQHGMTGTRTYRVWKNMLNRCRNPNVTGYCHYGGRGIVVCPEWYEFRSFLSDMGEAPEGLTLERIDVDGPYCRNNCEWATQVRQARNRRTTRYVRFHGVRASLADLAERYGVPYKKVWERLSVGWSLERALCP